MKTSGSACTARSAATLDGLLSVTPVGSPERQGRGLPPVLFRLEKILSSTSTDRQHPLPLNPRQGRHRLPKMTAPEKSLGCGSAGSALLKTQAQWCCAPCVGQEDLGVHQMPGSVHSARSKMRLDFHLVAFARVLVPRLLVGQGQTLPTSLHQAHGTVAAALS